MRKILGISYFIGALIWCLMLIPLSIALPLARIYQYFFMQPMPADILGYIFILASLCFSFLIAYFIPKFGVSLLKSSIAKLRNREEDPKEALIKRLRGRIGKET